jgi:glycosyltransferase involved in cell wall biosynthesis
MQRIIHCPHPPLRLNARVERPTNVSTNGRHEILFFGAIKPYKGVDILVGAGLAMAATRRDFRITIAGLPYESMESYQALIAKAGADDQFRFELKFLSDEELAKLLAAATIVVFPYRDIDGSGALSHAVQFAKPIVASEVGGFAESPIRDHVQLVPRENPSALATELCRLMDNPEMLQALGRLSAALREALPSWSEYARNCHLAYSEIIRSRKKA